MYKKLSVLALLVAVTAALAQPVEADTPVWALWGRNGESESAAVVRSFHRSERGCEDAKKIFLELSSVGAPGRQPKAKCAKGDYMMGSGAAWVR